MLFFSVNKNHIIIWIHSIFLLVNVLVIKHTVFNSKYKILEFVVIIYVLTLRRICLLRMLIMYLYRNKEIKLVCLKNDVFHLRKLGITQLLEGLT